jgi:hypothetical protein
MARQFYLIKVSQYFTPPNHFMQPYLKKRLLVNLNALQACKESEGNNILVGKAVYINGKSAKILRLLQA